MTAVDGPTSCGGMEYPMMTCIGGQWDTLGMYEVVVHEIAHMWHPMLVGSDEKRFAWMDEGFAQFNQSQAMPDFFKGYDDEAENREPYLSLAVAGGEVELMRHGDRYPNYTAYGTASYYKTATVLVALRGVLGKETFEKAFREYGRRWQYKHPTPYDFFNTVEDVAGPGPLLVLAHLVLRDLEAGPGDRHRRHRRRLARGRGVEPRPGADAGAPGRHPVGGRAPDRRDPGQRLVHRGEAHHGPYRPGAGDQDASRSIPSGSSRTSTGATGCGRGRGRTGRTGRTAERRKADGGSGASLSSRASERRGSSHAGFDDR